MNDVLFSHKSDHWQTPTSIYYKFASLGYFDPCPFHCISFDGLSIEWQDKTFVNPPYSEIGKWVDKAIAEASSGKRILMLLPVRSDTKWFNKLFEYGVYIEFIKGRLHFNNSKCGAPFPSMLVYLNISDHTNYFQVASYKG